MIRSAGPDVAGARHRNNFTLVRWIAATLVILSHAFALMHADGYYDERALDNPGALGWIAVNMFFVTSGYLNTLSLRRNPNIATFTFNRMLRIYPGLIVCTLLTPLVLGLLFQSAQFGHFLADRETLGWVLGNATAIFIRFPLPGIFASVPYADVVNGSLWSLPFEIGCYALLAVAMHLRLLAGPRRAVAAMVMMAVAYAIGAAMQEHGVFPASYTARTMHRLLTCFMIGVGVAILKDRLRLDAKVFMATAVLAAGSLFTPGIFLRDGAFTLAIAAFVFWFAEARLPFSGWVARLPDWSFGLYIYAYPVQQTLIALFPKMTPLENFVAAFAVTLVPAALSWHLVEHPALRLKSRKAAAPRAQLAAGLAAPGA